MQIRHIHRLELHYSLLLHFSSWFQKESPCPQGLSFISSCMYLHRNYFESDTHPVSHQNTAVIDADIYIPGGGGKEWYQSQNNFFRAVRNCKLLRTLCM